MPSTRQTSLTTRTQVQIRQYSLKKILGVWAAAALPMGALAWIVAPLLARTFDAGLFPALILSITFGLIWQCFLVLLLVYREQGTLRWSVLKDALWLHRPTSPRSGRRGGRVWLALIPFILVFAFEEALPDLLPSVRSHEFGTILQSDAGMAFFEHNWLWFGVTMTMLIFNTVLGEELLFRGLLLPRMNAVFGRGDGLVNGLLFTFYHLHQPWSMTWIPLDALALAYPSKWYRSALMGIAVHSVQTVVLFIGLLALVLR
jgi:membrane protease YdiL (CAAX protease family)